MSHQMLHSSSEGPLKCLPVHSIGLGEALDPGLEVEYHPLFSLMNSATQGRLLASGRSRTIELGNSLSINSCVTFVQDGLLGTVSRPSGVCVGVAGAGAVVGLSSAFNAPRQGHIVALATSRVFAAPMAVLIEGLGRSRVMELCMRQSLECLSAMESEAACNAAHLVPQRLAKWLVRLHRANREGDLRFTQSQLAQLLGVQRTSVNAAARGLQQAGAARFTRGRVAIRDLDSLTHLSCSCAV